MNELDKAYWAGVFDGEGAVILGAYKQSTAYIYHRYTCGVVISNSCNIFSQLIGEFGGHITKNKPQKEGHHTNLMWRLYGKRAEPFIDAIYPYCRIKQHELEIIKEFLKTMEMPYVRSGLPQTVIDKRNKFIEMLGEVRGSFKKKPRVPIEFKSLRKESNG